MLTIAVLLLTWCHGQVVVEGPQDPPTEPPTDRAADPGADRSAPVPVVVLPTPGRGPRVEITAAGVSIDGQLLPAQPTFEQLVAHLGQPSRSSPRANIVHTYDDHGIVLLQPHDRAEVIEISFYFSQMDIDFQPRSLFAGAVTLNGQAVHGGLNVADIPGLFPGLVFDADYTLSTVVNPSVEVFFRARPIGDKLGRVSVDFPH